MIDKKEQLYNVDGGRFKPVLSTLGITPECFVCSHFDETKVDEYRCACLGSCIGVTLSERLKEYLLSNIDKQSE